MIDHTFKGDSVRKLSVTVLILLLGFLGFQANTYASTTAGNVGIWWSVHLGYETFQVGPHHAATTEKAKRMIDHYRELGVPAMLVEGWNEGWEYRNKREDIPHFSQAAADYDLEEVVRYGRERGVEIVLHHETMGNIPHYEASLEDSFKMCQRLGIRYIKGGYAGKLKPLGTIKHSQIMVRHYRKLIELAAKYRIMVNIHEPIKMTGWRRTYPNYMTSEGGRGMEFNAWSEGNSPEHGLIIPFTRALAGPMDYNTGIFDIKFDLLKKKGYNWRKERRKGKYPSDPGPCVHTTLAKQLAQYVIFHSPMQMVPDIPENYLDRPEYQFIRDVDDHMLSDHIE
jgi:alpha-glucosidase